MRPARHVAIVVMHRRRTKVFAVEGVIGGCEEREQPIPIYDAATRMTPEGLPSSVPAVPVVHRRGRTGSLLRRGVGLHASIPPHPPHPSASVFRYAAAAPPEVSGPPSLSRSPRGQVPGSLPEPLALSGFRKSDSTNASAAT